ncbi:hypothetical protein FQA39_LY17055 [Lamprigera yunnana]|nr:hypothetical protein FQA39_LY17055 [Lamprigera yunnana]
MPESSVIVSLPHMVDLALNCPEVGAVNFNILHSLLHVLIQQVDLLDTKVEFKGNESERVQNLIQKGNVGPKLNLTEYIIMPGKEQKKVVSKKSRIKRFNTSDKGSKEEVVVEKDVRITDQKAEKHFKRTDDNASESMETVVVVETADTGGTVAPHVSVALSRVHFDDLEKELQQLKEEVKELKQLPANVDLITAIRSSSTSPVLDMFQILTLNKRIDASEEAVNKLATMIEDLAREQTTGSLVKTASHDKNIPTETQQQVDGDVGQRVENLEQRVKVLEDMTTKKASVTYIEPGSVQDSTVAASNASTESNTEEVAFDVLEKRICEVENKFCEYTDHVCVMVTTFNEQVNQLQGHLTDLEKEIGEIIEKINAGSLPGDVGGSEQGCRELYNKVMSLQDELEKVAEKVDNLINEKEDRQNYMDVLLEEIQLLKTIKANREDLQDALANKADTCTVNRKVSLDQFDAACDDLAHSIEDAVNKLTQQEQLWQNALCDIQQEIENKLDKMELAPLRDFVHNKLKMLQERLKALASLRKETEAAGTKNRFLRNVNCISCDKDVVMRKEMEPSLMVPPPSLPPTKSMGPYIAYELDQLRKQQKCAPHGRNMQHLEHALSGPKTDKHDHICNRYCGGSHTTTTPQQRVTRVGHFLQQWGPETLTHEGDIRGTDGYIYKSRNSVDLHQTKNAPAQFTKTVPSMAITGGILTERGKTTREGISGECAECYGFYGKGLDEVDSIPTSCVQLAKEQIIKYSDPKYNINDLKTGDCETMLLNQTIYYLNKSKSKWISVGLYYPFEFASVVKIFGRSKQYVIFKEEEWIQFHEQRENINKYFQTFDTMWKPRQIGSKTLTFEMIEEKKILKIEDMSGNEIYLGWESVSEVWSLESVLRYRLSYSSGSNFKHFYEDVIRAVAEMSGDVKINIYNIINRLSEKSDDVCCMLEVLLFMPEKALFDVQLERRIQEQGQKRVKKHLLKKMWMLYAQEHWTKCYDLKSAVERLYEELGALEFDADHEAIYGWKDITRSNSVKSFEINIRLEGSEIGLRHFLDTVNKYIKDCSDSSSSSDEEVFKAVEQNGEETTEEEEE